MNSTSSLTALIIGCVIAFAFGAAYKHMRLAFGDYKDSKAKTKRLRRFAWFTALPRALRTGLVVVLVIYITATWVRRDLRDNGPTPLVPTNSAGPQHVKKTPKHPYTPKTFGKP
jgi:hypothetical protein